MPQLLPDGLNDPAVQEPIAEDSVEYGSSWEFHMNEGCDCQTPFKYPHLGVRGNRVMRTEDSQTLEQWIRMTLATDRFRWEVYDNQYGTEFKQMIEDSIPEDEAETETIRVIRDSILLDPRIASVTSISVTDGRSEGNPSSFIAEVRVVTFTGELRLLRLDMSLTRTADAYFNS